ncbi:MAG: hypothetical protein HQL72_13375 [Magnetococcales bacterium]|nr:hypothetical protein [Magnetococcales bacterium]
MATTLPAAHPPLPERLLLPNRQQGLENQGDGPLDEAFETFQLKQRGGCEAPFFS